MNINSMTLVSVIMMCAAINSGCANSSARYQPIVDGRISADYYADVQACQNLALQRKFSNGDVRSEAAAGAIAGVLAGAIENGSDGAIAGAVIGSAVGAGGRAWDTRKERKQIVIECMKLRGHLVVG